MGQYYRHCGGSIDFYFNDSKYFVFILSLITIE